MTARVRAFWTRTWHCHSLTIAMGVAGLVCYVGGWIMHVLTPDWLRTSDFLYNIGHGFFPLAVYNMLAGRLRELNRPEDWMPSKTKKQARTMAAACKSKKFAKKVGIPKKVACEFHNADPKSVLRK